MRRQEVRRDGRARADAQRAGADPANGGEGLVGRARLGEDRARVAQQDETGLRESHPRGPTLHQRDAGLALQITHAFGHGRLRQAKLRGGAREAPLVGDRDEHAEQPEAECHNEMEWRDDGVRNRRHPFPVGELLRPMVRFALRQPYTVAVLCGVLLLMAILSGIRMAVDIFPLIDIPVVAVVWTYPGMLPQDMESRVVLLSERGLSSTVNGISRIESQSEYGVGLEKVFFQPGTNIGNAIAQIVASSQTAIKAMPPGITPPYVIQSNASNVPVAQLTLASETMPE